MALPSLYHLCFISVLEDASTIYNYYENLNINLEEIAHSLVPQICEDLINRCPLDLMMPVTLYYLLKPGVKCLLLQGYQHRFPVEDFSLVCKNLLKIDLSSSVGLSKENLEELILHLPNVFSLGLSWTSCSDDTLAIIGRTCHILEKLDISACSVTDAGLRNLCYKSKDQEKHHCKHLKVLIAYHTAITAEGLAYLLEYLPLQYVKITRNLYVNMLNCYTLRNFNKTCHLKSLSVKKQDNIRDLEELLHCCPDLMNLKIYKFAITDADMFNFPPLNNLQEFDLNMRKRNRSLTFDEGITNFFIKSGRQLVQLTLINLSYVNLYIIGKYCENLRSLELYRIFHLYFKGENSHCVFSNLKKFLLKSPRSAIWEGCLNRLFTNSPNLQAVQFYYVSCLTNDVILEIIPCMNSVTRLEFYGCENFTSFSLYFIFSHISELKALSIISQSDIISVEEKNYFLNYVKKCGRSLDFNYFNIGS